MNARMTIAAVAVAILALPMSGGIALAGPEWCDDGSPPPNDWRFRMTGAPSSGSSTAWLNSTTGGTLDLSAGINTLEGGVAKGMLAALERAGAKVTGRPDARAHPERERDERAEPSERPAREGRRDR